MVRKIWGRHLPRRNRIISGLPLNVFLVKAAKCFSSLTTAQFATEQDGDVLTDAGSPLDPRTHETGKLIRDGATLVVSTDHILKALQRFQPIGMPSTIHTLHDQKSEPNQHASKLAIHTPIL